MEAAAAFGIAGGVAQFVSFTAELLSQTREIHSSVQGASSRVTNLTDVYAKLRELSTDLTVSPSATGSAALDNRVKAIVEIAKQCESDCKKLLDVLDKLCRAKPTKKWSSFKMALKTVWSKDEIDDLERRVGRSQGVLTLYINELVIYLQGRLEEKLETMAQVNQSADSQHESRITDLTQQISQLSANLSTAMVDTDRLLTLQTSVSSLQQQVSELSKASADLSKQQAILSSLDFDSRLKRQHGITEAGNNTFSWVFDGQNTGLEGAEAARLLAWLGGRSTIFWVSGKPGSGKSTLMKYVSNHPKTLEALKERSRPKRTIIITHFFYALGSEIQKSWQGCLRTLLFGVFRQVPELILPVCAQLGLDMTARSNEWSVKNLVKALKSSITFPNIPLQVCIFLDGLDEMDGDHLELCEQLEDISRNCSVKLCVASRPLNNFEHAFGLSLESKLYMHKLTRRDIRIYAQSRLEAHRRWQTLGAGKETSELLDRITRKAEGVFLWVVLMVKLLQRGLSDQDSIADLFRRLESMPAEMEAFLKSLLDSVDPFNHDKMANTLQIALISAMPQSLLFYHFLDLEFSDLKYALTDTNLDLSLHGVEELTLQITDRLNGQFCGILEVWNGDVRFIHRSVRDFLKTAQMTKYLNEKAPSWFNARLSIIKACSKFLKAIPLMVDYYSFCYSNWVMQFMNAILNVSDALKTIDETPKPFQILHEILLSFERIRVAKWRLMTQDLGSHCLGMHWCWSSLYGARYEEYLSRILQDLPNYLPSDTNYSGPFRDFLAKTRCRILLSVTTSLNPEVDFELDGIQTKLNLAEAPFDVDPSTIRIAMSLALQEVQKKSIPCNIAAIPAGALDHRQQHKSQWDFAWLVDSGIIQILLDYGANPRLAGVWRNDSASTPIWINFVLMSFCLPPNGNFNSNAYVDLLDRFLANASSADSRRKDLPTGFSAEPGLTLFLDHLSQVSKQYDRPQWLYHLWLQIFVRLFAASRSIHDRIDDERRAMMSQVFPPPVISELNNQLLVAECRRNKSLLELIIRTQRAWKTELF